MKSVPPLARAAREKVYRARDVAIKVLPEAFAHDPERLSRFQREAKMLAVLNHANMS